MRRKEEASRVERVACMFGLDLERDGRGACALEGTVSALERALGPGEVGLVTGPSGAGKSSVLRGVVRARRRAGARVIDVGAIDPSERPCVECFGVGLDDSLALLARAGLAEARCFVRTPRELSEGQRFRLRLAMAMHRAGKGKARGRGALVVADEFASTLDRVTALALAASVRRRIGEGAALLAASAHEDLEGALRAHVVVRVGLGGGARMERPAEVGEADPYFVRVEGRGAYDALAAFHYRAGAPATIERVLALRREGLREPVGALVVSRPALRAPWREVAWPGEYSTGDGRRDAARVNAEVRTISRVVIDPRFRALGLATRLVRAYLGAALTVRTEAVAAMGRASGFFAGAGMVERRFAPARRHLRLLDALEHAGIEPGALARPRTLARRLERSARLGEFVGREVRLWADASCATRGRRDAPVEELLRLAGRSVVAEPVAYTHERAGVAGA